MVFFRKKQIKIRRFLFVKRIKLLTKAAGKWYNVISARYIIRARACKRVCYETKNNFKNVGTHQG